MKSYIIQSMLTLLVMTRLASAQRNLVVNGSFDQDASSWVPYSGYYDPLGGNPGGCVVLTGGSGIAQTVTNLVAGLQYVVSGNYQYYGTTPGELLVSVASGVNITIDELNVSPADNIWNSFDFVYAATSSSAHLAFGDELIYDPPLGFVYGEPFAVDNISMSVIQPPLTLVYARTNVILMWPTNFSGFTLQSTTNFVPPAIWAPVSSTVVVVSTNNVVTNDISSNLKFYRLSR
jgi:hypothetical protein